MSSNTNDDNRTSQNQRSRAHTMRGQQPPQVPVAENNVHRPSPLSTPDLILQSAKNGNNNKNNSDSQHHNHRRSNSSPKNNNNNNKPSASPTTAKTNFSGDSSLNPSLGSSFVVPNEKNSKNSPSFVTTTATNNNNNNNVVSPIAVQGRKTAANSGSTIEGRGSFIIPAPPKQNRKASFLDDNNKLNLEAKLLDRKGSRSDSGSRKGSAVVSGNEQDGDQQQRRKRGSTTASTKKANENRHEKHQHELLTFPQQNWRITMRSIFYPGLRREELQLKALRGEILTEHLQLEKEKDSKNNDNKPDEVQSKIVISDDSKTNQNNIAQNSNKTSNSNDRKTEIPVNEKDPKLDKKTSQDVTSNNNSSPQEQTKLKIVPPPLDDNDNKPKKIYKADELAPLHPMVAHWFENIMYCVIVLNIVVLGTTDPYELRTDKKMQDGSGLSVLKTTNIAVAAALCFEQLIFGTALGFNKLLKVRQFLQLVVVVAASISLVVDVSGGYPNRYFGGSVVLILRLIRPLRHFAVFERLAVLTEAITGTISKLFDVTFLFMLFLVVAAVSLVSFAGGALQHRCVNDDYWNISTRNAWNFSVAAKTAGQPMIDFVCGGAYDAVLAKQYWSLSSSTMDMRDVSRYCNGHRSDDLDRIVEWVTVPVFNATSNTTKMIHKKLVTCNAPPNPQDQIAPLFRPDGSSSGCSPDQVCDPGKQRFLGVSFGFQCPFHYTCDLVQNPRNGWAGFDNFGMALQSMFVSATWQTWFDLATSAADATNVSLMLYFVAFIWFADMLTGLILVKISLAFEQASQKAQRSWHELRERQQQDERRRQELTGESSASLISSIKSLAAAVVVQRKTEEKFKQKEELSLDTYLTTGKVSESTVAEVAKQQQRRPASLSIAVGNKNVDGDEKENKKNNNNNNNRAASAPAAAATGAKKSSVLPRKNTLSKLKNAALAVGQEALKEKQKQREQEELRQKSFITRNTQIASLFLTDLEIRTRSWRMMLAKNILCTKPYFFFIAFVNTANVIIIAFYQKTMSSFVTKLYFYGDLFCLVFLTFDVVLRITVMAPTTFMKSSVKNHVDFVVTVLSWIDVALNVQNMKAVRILRALRPIELLAYSPNLYKWVKFAMVAVQASPVVLFVLFCVMVVFALAGMQLLGGTFCGLGTSGIVVPDNAGGRCGSEGPRPRAHFDDFGHALLTSFQIVTGDNWDDVMWNAMTTRGWWMGIFFSVYYFFGAYMMLALLQGIIFSSFAQQSLKEDVARRARANAISPTGRRAIDASGNNTNNNNNNNNKDDDQTTGTVVHIKSEVEKELDTVEGENDAVGTVTANPLSPNNQINFNLVGATEFVKTFLAGKGVQLSMFRKKKSFLENSLSSSDDDDDQEENRDAETSSNGDDDDEKKEQENEDVDKSNKKSKKIKRGRGKSASPKSSLNSDDLDSLFGADRKKTWKDVREEYLQPIARHKYTENFILLVILGSIVANVVTDPTNAPDSPEARNAFILELVTRALFFVEAVFMILAYGIDPRDPQSYLRRTGWHVFEFIITIANVVSIFLSFTVESDHPAVLFFSTFIAIRPLRIVRKSGSMSLVLRALGSALLSMRHAIMVIFILIILYAIAGTQVFAGKFDACIGNMTLDRDACLANGYDFNNQVPSFDNAFESLFSVFNILTLELWSEMMYTAMDITQRNKAPVPNANAAAALYFVFFAVIGGWFCVSIFMSVLVDSYNRCKRTESAQRSILIDREQNGWLKSNLYLVRALPNHALLHEHRHPSLFSNVKNNVVVFSDSDDDEDENKMGKANMNMIGPDGTGDAELDMILNDSFTNNNSNKRRRRGSTKKSKLQALGLAENIDEDLDELLGTLATSSSNNNNNNNTDSNNNNKKLQKNQKHPADITFGQFLLGKIRGVYGDFTATLDRSPTYRHVQKQFGDIVRAPWFVLACNVISVANFLLLCVQIFPTPDMYGQVLETLQDVLAVLFGLEAFCKILGESFAVYITSKWNKFDFFVAATSIIGLMFRSIIDSRIRSALWSIRLIRIVKIFRGRKSLATLVSHFGVALTSLAGVFSIILIFFFAFAVFSSQLFGKVIQHEDIDGSSDSISRHANFAKVPMAMYTLVRIAFMGDWPHLYWGMKKNSPGCEPRLGNCGPATPIPQAFFVCSIIFCTYVCRNLVLAVLIDSFSSAGDIRSIQKWQAKAIVKAWKCHDPEFTGVMRGFDVIHVLRKIPIWCTLGFRHFAHSNRIQLEMAFLTLLNVDDPNANNFAFIQKRREEAQAQVQSIGSIMLQQQQHQQQLNKNNNNKSPSSPTALKTANSISSPTNNNNAASSPPSSPKIKPSNNINDSSFATSPLVISAEARQRLSHGGVTFENFVDVLCHMSFNCPAPQKRSLKMHRMYEKDHVGESGDALEAPDQMAYENAVRIIFNAAMKRLIARRRKRLRAASFARKKGRLEAGLAHLRKNNNNDNDNKNGDDDAADSDFDMMMMGDPSGSAPSSPTRKPKLVSHSTNAAEELAKKVMSGGSTLGETVSWLFEKVKGIAKSMTTDFTRPTAKDEFGVALSDDDEDDDDAKKMALDAAFDEDALNDDVEKKLEDATYEDWDFCETSDWHLRSERSRAKTTKHAVTHSWFTMKGDEGMKLLQGTPPPDEPLDDVELLPISKKDFEAFSLV